MQRSCGPAMANFGHIQLRARIYPGDVTDTWWQYVVRVAKTDSQKSISEQSGVGETVLSRWKQGKNTPSAEKAIDFARALGRSPAEALVAAGYIRKSEIAGVVEVGMSPAGMSSDELLAELRRRIVTAEAKPSPAGLPDEGMPRDLSEDGYPSHFKVPLALLPGHEPDISPSKQSAPGTSAQPRRR